MGQRTKSLNDLAISCMKKGDAGGSRGGRRRAKKVAGLLGIDAAGSALSAAEVSTQGDTSSSSYGHLKFALLENHFYVRAMAPRNVSKT